MKKASLVKTIKSKQRLAKIAQLSQKKPSLFSDNLYRKREKIYKKNKKIKKITLFGIILFIILTTLFFIRPSFTGLVVGETTAKYSENLNLNFNENQTFIFTPKEEGEILSVEISGEIQNKGIVKIQIDNQIIFDSTKLTTEEKEIRQSKKIIGALTGQTIENTSTNFSNKENFSFQEKPTEKEVQKINTQEKEEETNQTSQENASSSQSENLIYFQDYCLETCSIEIPKKENYEIKIEIINSSLNLKKINYIVKNPKQKISLPEISLQETKTEQQIAKINEPVIWKKYIKLNESKPIKISLPKNSKNIEIKKIKDDEKTEVEKTNKKITEIEYQEKKPFTQRISLTGRVIDSINTTETIEIIINETANEYEITYETEPPQKQEEQISKLSKKITIYTDEELNYTNIVAYTTLEEEVEYSQIALYHLISEEKNKINITTKDKNNNGKIDYLEWIVPHLSNQTYLLELTILNIQSYPIVGGNWTVNFETTGKNNFTITGVNNTLFSEDNSKDLKLLNITCGEKKLEYTKINNSFFIQDYECLETGKETSQVLTEGKHTLEFKFGEIIKFANNFATYSPKTCLDEWGFDCSIGPPEENSNTWDDCSTGSGQDESVENIYLSSGIVRAGEELQVTCEFDPYDSNDDIFIWYYNGNQWEILLEERNIGSPTLINRTIIFKPDQILGKHWIRCSIVYGTNTEFDECSDSGSWYDNDDISFNVTTANQNPTQDPPLLNSSSEKNTTMETLICNTINTLDSENDPLKKIINWNKNNESLTILNLPFEGGSNNTYTKDYSSNPKSISTNALWQRNQGHDSFGAYYLNGSSYIRTNFDLSTILGSTATLSFFLKTNQTGDDTTWMAPGITGIEESGGSNDIFWGWIDSSGYLGFSAGNGAAAKSTTIINDNQWHHIALTRNHNTGEIKIFIDGTLETTEISEIGNKTLPFYSIGLIEDTGGTPEYLIGLLDDLLLFDYILSEEQISNIANKKNNLLSSTETKVEDIFQCESTISDQTSTSSTLKSNFLEIIEGIKPTTPTRISCDSGNCNGTFISPLNIKCSGSTTETQNSLSYKIYGKNIISQKYSISGNSEKISVEDPNYSTKTCSEEWGFDCSVGPPESQSNTIDECNSGLGNDESVNEIYLNSSSVKPGESVLATCEFDPYTSGDDTFIWFHNGEGWTKIYEHLEWGSTNLVNESVIITAPLNPGTYHVRCGIQYYTGTENCAGGDNYFDNDDISFQVVLNESQTEQNSTEKVFLEIGGPTNEINQIKITLNIDTYNPEVSIKNNNKKPDLFLSIWDGVGWFSFGELNLPELYSDINFNKEISILIQNSTIINAWKLQENQNIKVKAINLDSNEINSDEINYSSIDIFLENYTSFYIGEHTEESSINYDISSLTQSIDELSCFAFETLYPEIISNNFTTPTDISQSEDIITAPEITVYETLMTDVSSGLNEGPLSTPINIKFQAFSQSGFTKLQDSTATMEISKPNEQTKTSLCSRITAESSGKYANYSCSFEMNFWDAPGTWRIKASIQDHKNILYEDSSKAFQVGATSGFIIENTSISWNELNPGATNQESLSPIKLKNTGNTQKQIKIYPTDLIGETDSTKKIFANNFTIGPNPGCVGTQMQSLIEKTINEALLTRGNYLYENGTAEEELFFCIKEIPSDLTQQKYSTTIDGAWIIKIFSAILLTAKRKKLKKELEKLKQKGFTKDEIIEILSENQEEKIPIDIFKKNIGALEAITKYLKENLMLSYLDISKTINKDQRTIWTAYKKSNKKIPSKFKIKTDICIPLKIFEETNLTILETVILYLKNNNLKYSEIGKLIERNEKNIWTIHNRARQKISSIN